MMDITSVVPKNWAQFEGGIIFEQGLKEPPMQLGGKSLLQKENNLSLLWNSLRNMFSITLMENINILILWADQALLSESYAFLKGHSH